MKYIELGSQNHYDYMDGLVIGFKITINSATQVNWYDHFVKYKGYDVGDMITAGWLENRSEIGKVLSIKRIGSSNGFDDEATFKVELQKY